MSLFGLTPQQVRSNARFQNRVNAAQFGGWGMLGNKLGSLFGAKDENSAGVERAARIHDIKKRTIANSFMIEGSKTPVPFQQLDNQAKLKHLASAYLNAGEVEIASGIMQQGQQMLGGGSTGQLRKPLATTKGFFGPDKGAFLTDPETGERLMPIPASPDLKREMMRASGEGQGISKVVTSAYEGIDNITQNIADLKEARRLVVEEGADTGPLVSKMPTLRSASRKLKTIQSKLGLNVVGSVTFGALSKGELDLALSTALDTGLDGPDLVDWIDRKIAAQEKLMENLGLAADYLSVPGNTRAGWRKEVKKMKGKGNNLTPKEQRELEQLERELGGS